jgi:hypothetical protein
MTPNPPAWYPVPPSAARCEVIADLVTTCIDQNGHDYTALKTAADDGRVAVQSRSVTRPDVPALPTEGGVRVHTTRPRSLRLGTGGAFSSPHPRQGGRTVDLAVSVGPRVRSAKAVRAYRVAD